MEKQAVTQEHAAASSFQLPAHLGDAPPPMPPKRTWRALIAYWTTFRVLLSYSWIRFQARFRDPARVEIKLAKAHAKNAQRIEKAIRQLQGLFIKVGQLISIMTNFLPDEFSKGLEGLQDKVPPRPFADIEKRIQEEFDGSSHDELFKRFDRSPVASASIGQVHMAKLPNGTRVAVKVQYPDIDAIVKRDLKILSRIFRIAGWFLKYRGLNEVYREIRAMIVEELDFTIEAQNSKTIASHFTERTDVAFPEVIDRLSTGKILTTRFESGCKVNDLEQLERTGIDQTELAKEIVKLYCEQIFEHGIYHADPHPGNLLVRSCEDSPNGFTVVFIDFGAVARVSPTMRKGLAELVQGALARDTQKIIHAIRSMGFVARDADDDVFEQVVEFFYDRFEQQISLESFNLKDVKFDPDQALENLADLRTMDLSIKDMTSQFHVPKEWILLERTLILIMGICTRLAPTLNPMPLVRPHVEDLVLGDHDDWSSLVLGAGRELLLSAVALPGDMRKFIRKVDQRGLKMRVQSLADLAEVTHRAGIQICLTLMGLAAAGVALWWESSLDPRSDYAWWTAGALGVLWGFSILRTRRVLLSWHRRDKRLSRRSRH